MAWLYEVNFSGRGGGILKCTYFALCTVTSLLLGLPGLQSMPFYWGSGSTFHLNGSGSWNLKIVTLLLNTKIAQVWNFLINLYVVGWGILLLTEHKFVLNNSIFYSLNVPGSGSLTYHTCTYIHIRINKMDPIRSGFTTYNDVCVVCVLCMCVCADL